MYIEEAKQVINYLLDNNLELIKNGQNKIAIGLEGAPGIGKTQILKEIAEARGAKYVRIELASMEEIGDLIGIPCKELIMRDLQGNEQWVTEKLIEEYLSIGYKLCPDCEPRMTYAIPSWVPIDNDQEVILVLDDYTRASGLFMQAIMSLIQFGEYISWKLPEKTHLLLTSNEDNGSMNVSSLDSAQSSRMITFHLEFNNDQYCAWMDKNNLRSELINFALLNPEIFEQNDTINARTYTMFANALAGFKSFDSIDTLNTVDLIAKGCFGKDTNIGDLFVAFVHNNLDKLIDAKIILFEGWDTVQNKIKNCVFKNGEYRADISSVLTIRIRNYIKMNSLKGDDLKKVASRLEEIITYPEVLFSEDLLFTIVKDFTHNYPQQSRKLLALPQVLKKLM